MKKVVDYQIIQADTYLSLREEVLENTKRGYELQGGVSICKIGSQDGRVAHFYAQAIVKYED